MKLYKAVTSLDGPYASSEEEAWESLSDLIHNSRLKELNTKTQEIEVSEVGSHRGVPIYKSGGSWLADIDKTGMFIEYESLAAAKRDIDFSIP